jgi:transcriptional regulator with XRE-family HTH domain
MEAKEWFKNQLDTYKNDAEYQTEMLQLKITEQILSIMNEKSITRTMLAEKMGCSNAYITKLLNGKENLTLRKLTEIASVLERSIEINFRPQQALVVHSFLPTYKKVDQGRMKRAKSA